MTYEKERYLRLDASPLEHGQVKRFMAPGAMSAAFLSAVIIYTPSMDDGMAGAVFPAALFTTAGLIQRRILGVCTNVMWSADFNVYVIDTKPKANTIHNPPPFYTPRAIVGASVNTMAPLFNMMRGIADFNDLSLDQAVKAHFYSTFRIDLPWQMPTLINGVGQAIAYHQVKSGKWKIIKQVDMEPEPETEKEGSLAPLRPQLI